MTLLQNEKLLVGCLKPGLFGHRIRPELEQKLTKKLKKLMILETQPPLQHWP